jgi:glycosyltransferase involved in cell wall biosynthesis
MIKILAIINGWRNKIIRGGDYHILKVLDFWASEHQISFIMPKLGYQAAKNMLNYPYTVYLSSQKEDEETDNLTRLIFSYLIRILKSLFFKPKENVDLVLASSHRLYDVIPAVFLSRRLNCKLVVYVHHLLLSFRKYQEGLRSSISLISEEISLLLCRNADLIFVMNYDTKDALVHKGFDANKIFVTANAVEHRLIDSVKEEVKTFDGCFCGSLIKRKGIYDLLEIWQKVLQYFPQSKLIVIGHGPEYSNLSEIVKKKGLNQTILLAGHLSERQKISVMKSSRIFVFPSYEEGWGIAISEAMACGLPIVCYELLSYKVFGDLIIKVEIGNRQAMARVIIDLLSKHCQKTTITTNTIGNIKLLTWENIATKELQEIMNVVKVAD